MKNYTVFLVDGTRICLKADKADIFEDRINFYTSNENAGVNLVAQFINTEIVGYWNDENFVSIDVHF